MKRNGGMTFAAVMTITIALFLCGIFGLLIMNVDANATQLESDVEIVAYIKDTVKEADYPKIESAIKSLTGYASHKFISKDDGLSSMAAKFGKDTAVLQGLNGTNPLPDAYSIKAVAPENVVTIADAIAALPEIDSVRYGQGTVEKLFAFTDILRIAGFAVMALLAVAAIVLVSMTTRLAVYARQREIMIMRWVGATNWYIRWPFLVEGIFLGLLGSSIACALVLWAYSYLHGYLTASIPFMVFLNVSAVWWYIVPISLFAGVMMGLIGSISALRKFLKV